MSPTTTGGREALLAATLAVVVDEGVSAVTARRVAARAGVSPGTVTHHFPSVDGLLVTALREACGHVVSELERLALALQDGDGDGEAFATAFATLLADDLDRHPERHLACFELRLLAVRRPELAEVSDAIIAAYVRVARIVLRALGARDVDGAAIRLVAMVTGLLLAEVAVPAEGRARRLRAHLVAQVRHAG